MEFLGYSQTFVGVLTSLVVLCILDSGNFIHGILKKIGGRIDRKITELDKVLKTNRDDLFKRHIKEEAAYKLFEKFIEDHSGWEKKVDDVVSLHREALKLEMNLEATFSENKSACSPNLIKPARNIIKKIKLSKEKLIAPLYVLLYCLVVFVCDEIIYLNFLYADFIVTFLSIFTMLSFVFWSFLWLSFYLGIKLIPEQNEENGGTNTNTEKKEKLKEWICKHATWGKTIIVIITFFILCILLSSLIDILFLKQICVFIIGVFAVIIIIACYRIKSHTLLGQYLYIFSFKHFLCLLLLALLMTIVIEFLVNLNYNYSQILFIYENFALLKMAVIAFIIINGLLLPFILPCLSFYKIQGLVSKGIDKIKEGMDKDLAEAKKDLEEFCKKL